MDRLLLWNRQSHIHVWWRKIGKDTSGVSDPSPRPAHTAQGSSARKISPHHFWMQKQVEVAAVEESAGFSGDFS